MNKERTPLLAANWKMNLHWQQCHDYAQGLQDALPEWFQASPEGVLAPALEVAVLPSLPYLTLVHGLFKDSAVFLGAQDVSRFEEGAVTGDVSGKMLSDCGCDYCLVGHSERRDLLGETDSDVALKLRRLHEAEVIPILCLGESLSQREAGSAVEHTVAQLEAVKEELSHFDVGGLVLAYEPIWAIGTGRSASTDDAQEIAAALRDWLLKNCGDEQAESTLILYGGSVNPENIGGYLACADIDGALIGNASLQPDSLAAMARVGLTLMN